MNKNVGIIVAVVVIMVVLVLFMGAQPSTNDEKMINETVNGVEKLDSDTVIKDDQFLQWAEMVYESMNVHISDVANATMAGNYSTIEEQGKFIVQDTEVFLNQSIQFQVSSGLNSTLEEIQQSLEDYNVAGQYLEIAGRDRDDNSSVVAADYAGQADDHMQSASLKVQHYKRNR